MEKADSRFGRLRLLHGESYTASIKPNLAFRVYADSRPHNLKISSLQKGLVLILDGKELIEEGAGFGVPITVFSDKTYFSSSAQVLVYEAEHSRIIVKRFLMDTSSRRNWKIGSFVDNPFYKRVSSFLEAAYRNYPNSRKVILPLMGLKNKVGVKTDFIPSEPRGEVTMTYKVKQDRLDIEADLTGLAKDKRLLTHGKTMAALLLLHSTAILLIMIPSFLVNFGALKYVSDPRVIITWIHATVGILTEALGVFLVSKWRFRPKNVATCATRRKFMIPTFTLWGLSAILGIVFYAIYYL